MFRSWTIGSLLDCDLVVNLPTVSGHHCRLTLDERGYKLEDLDSSNGTYVNGVRITGMTWISTGDLVTLGRTTQMPWPAGAPKTTILRVGRDSDNDFVIALPIVSGHHAQVVWEGKPGEATVKDLGSANGTSVGSPDRKSPQAIFNANDTIYFGTHAVPGSELLRQLMSFHIPFATTSSLNEWASGSISETGSETLNPPIASKLALFPNNLILDLTRLLQAPVLAFAICAIFRSSSTTREASVLFWLGLVALWYGLSNTLVENVVRSNRPHERSSHLATYLRGLGKSSLLGILQCLAAWIIVSQFFGVGEAWLFSFALLVVTSGVGLALGCLIVSLDLKPRMRLVALAIVMLPLWLFGGGPQSPPRTVPWVRMVSNAMPTRWTFEGLLLLESKQPVTHETVVIPAQERKSEMADHYFPSDSEQMGIKADLMTLMFMLLGICSASTFLTWASREGRVAT